MAFGQKMGQIHTVPSFWLKFDDVTVTLSLIVLSWIFFTNSPWYYLTSCQYLLILNVIFMVSKIGQLFNIFKILIILSFWLMFDNFTVTLSLIVLSWIFFTNLPLYYPTSHQNLLRLNVIFMVRKIGKKDYGLWLPPPPPQYISIV